MTRNPVSDIANNRNKTAVGLMFVAVLGYSLLPLFVALGGNESPFIFNAVFRIGMASGCALFLLIAYRHLLFSKTVWSLIKNRIVNLSMSLWIVSYFSMAFYAWSVQFIDVSIAAVLYETWPILFIILTGWLFSREKRYRKITARILILFFVAFLGVASVIASQAGGLGNLWDTSLFALGLGVVIVITAGVLTSLTAFGFRWGSNLASELSDIRNYDKDALEMFCVIVGIAICCFLTVPLTTTIGFARNEPLSSETVIFGALSGVIVGAGASIIWRKANFVTHDLSINSMLYLTPVFALVWLFIFSQVGNNIDVVLLLIGATAIVIANVGVYFELDAPQRQPVDAPDSVNATALIAAGESDKVEFKSTLRTNLHTNRRDRAMEAAVTKTLAAFLNSEGGALVVGVADDGALVGIAVDGFATEDRMSLHLRNIVNRDMGPLAMAYIRLSYEDCDGVRVMVAQCERSERAIYVKEGNSEKFYIRTGPSTTELVTSAAVEYIRTRFES